MREFRLFHLRHAVHVDAVCAAVDAGVLVSLLVFGVRSQINIVYGYTDLMRFDTRYTQLVESLQNLTNHQLPYHLFKSIKGIKRYCRNLEIMWQFKIGPWLKFMWVFTTPFFTLV